MDTEHNDDININQHDLIDDIPSNEGINNAIKKAKQFSQISWMAVDSLYYNNGFFKIGYPYQGIIYSSVKELNNFVGEDISIETYITALHNKRSVIYEELSNKKPYHGVNSVTFYGTVCSGLINYCHGFSRNYTSYELVNSDFIVKLPDQTAGNVELGDILWRPGHVALITGIKRDQLGVCSVIEITESVSPIVRNYELPFTALQDLLDIREIKPEFGWTIYRNSKLEDNTIYYPSPFVILESEALMPYKYNDDIMSYRGEKSQYIEGENIKLIINEDYQSLGYTDVVLYKNGNFIESFPITEDIITLENLEYGDYKASIITSDYSIMDFTEWKVVDVNVTIDIASGIITFKSANAIPIYYEFCDIHGFRSFDSDIIRENICIREFTKEEIDNGYAYITLPSKDPDFHRRVYPYLKVHFQTEYGRVINKPIKWF